MRGIPFLALFCACGGDEKDAGSYPESRAVAFPKELTGSAPAIVLRITNASTIDTSVYDALNRLANQELDLGALLMRGGLRHDDAGDPITPAEPDPAGTAVEQLASRVAAGGVVGDAPDLCGNPMLAAFVTPDMAQHAGAPTDGEGWPAACAGNPDCDTLQHGIVEVVLSQVRYDGMMDMVVNVYANVADGTPALWGHLLAYWLTDDNPGFVEAPVAFNAGQFQLGLFNVWQRTLTYTHDGVGVRDVIVLPHTPRTFDPADLLVTYVPHPAQDCIDRWRADFGGVDAYGCADQSPILLDRNSPAGEEIYVDYMKDGTDPSNLKQLELALNHQIQSALVCPPIEEAVWIQEGPVEIFTCPAELGGVATCMALQDMEEYACRPVVGTETDVTPVGYATDPVPLAEQREPFVVRNDPLLPFAGPEIEFEVTVDADTVLYLPDPTRFTEVNGPSGSPVELPEPLPDTHCDTDPPFRYDVGASWPAGTYTLVAPWTVVSEELRLHVTSVESWKF